MIPRSFVLRPGLGRKLRGIIKAYVDYLRCTRKQRALLVGAVADGDYVVEGDLRYFVNGLRALAGNIDACLLHNRHSPRVEPVRSDSRGVRLDDLPLEMPRPPFGHLAPAGVARAQEEHLDSRVSFLHSFSRSICRT